MGAANRPGFVFADSDLGDAAQIAFAERVKRLDYRTRREQLDAEAKAKKKARPDDDPEDDEEEDDESEPKRRERSAKRAATATRGDAQLARRLADEAWEQRKQRLCNAWKQRGHE